MVATTKLKRPCPSAVPERKRARRAALIARLTASPLVPDRLEVLLADGPGGGDAPQPAGDWRAWLREQVVVTQLRISRIERVEQRLRDWAAYRAIDWWEEDQALAAEELGSKIEQHPAQVVAHLRRTPAGSDWLLKRWRLLAAVEPADWTEDQRKLAAAMLGETYLEGDTLDVAAADQVVTLRDHRERLHEADEIARGLIEVGLTDDLGPEFRRLRRFEATLHARLRWFVAELHTELPGHRGDPATRPASPAVPEPAAAPISPADETNPSSPTAPAPPGDETNPLLPTALAPAGDETNPLLPTAAVPEPAEIAEGPPPRPAAKPFDPVEYRKRRIDPGRVLASQRRARRRHA